MYEIREGRPRPGRLERVIPQREIRRGRRSLSRDGQGDTRGAKPARLVGRGVLPGGEAGIHRGKKSSYGGPRAIFFFYSDIAQRR